MGGEHKRGSNRQDVAATTSDFLRFSLPRVGDIPKVLRIDLVEATHRGGWPSGYTQ